MSWMNEAEIEWAYEQHQHKINGGGDAVRVLKEFKDFANENSDGWVYCRAFANAAKQLTDLVQSRGVKGRMFPSTPITEKELRKVLSPIKSLCTRKKLAFVPHVSSKKSVDR